MVLRMLAVAAVVFAVGRPLSRGWLALAAGGRPDTALVIQRLKNELGCAGDVTSLGAEPGPLLQPGSLGQQNLTVTFCLGADRRRPCPTGARIDWECNGQGSRASHGLHADARGAG
jgi:hypothetical protein